MSRPDPGSTISSRRTGGSASAQQHWAAQNLEYARSEAALTLGTATRSANQLNEAISRDPGLAERIGPLASRMYAAAAAARLVESDVATALAEQRRWRPIYSWPDGPG